MKKPNSKTAKFLRQLCYGSWAVLSSGPGSLCLDCGGDRRRETVAS